MNRRRTSGQVVGRCTEAGMTLIEIMVVVAIIGLMLGGVGVYAINKYRKAQETQARQVVANVRSAVEHYSLENPGKPCPKEIQGLVDDGQMKKIPKDPWGKKLLYKCPGEQDPEGADITSRGRDGKEGTEDDVNSWEL